jgi:hypothetical protein
LESPKVTPYPQAGHRVLEFEERLDRQLAGDTTETKRGPGSPQKELVSEPEKFDLAVIDNY